ncbi:AAA-domain-containing protein [Hymenopellis radicata]|nr:AAA-domain-containing protein [Hymenopellis radicata]
MSFFGGRSNPAPRSSSPYSRVPDGPTPGLPPRGAIRQPQYNTPPNAYNDPSGALFEKRSDARRPPPPTSGSFEVVSAPNETLALKNRLVVNPSDFAADQHVLVRTRQGGKFPISVLHDNTNTLPRGFVGAGAAQRAWMQLSKEGDHVSVEPLGSLPYLQSVDIEVSFNARSGDSSRPYEAEQIELHLRDRLVGAVLAQDTIIAFDFASVKFKGQVIGVSTVELTDGQQRQGNINAATSYGIVADYGKSLKTDFNIMKGTTNPVNIKSSGKKARSNAILAPNFKFQDMGIGGLDTEFSEIFRRAFASRVFPPALVEKLGIEHVKGILLHGPPGTGKTLIARQIGKMLNAREPKIVNGPEILSKFVGASEENIRKLFADAEKEYKEKGDESDLHIIIFDELDAIFKQRGSTNSGTGVGDTVVNQLLSKMDGVDQLNNILIIGMTNRKDMIDEALLRPGRLEVHMEISLPDEHGRFQILNIHTNKMRTNGVMDSDVDLAELAGLTKNFSGAEIGGLIKSATSFAFNRHVKVGTMAGIGDDVENLRVNRDDFMHALEEVHPAFGVSEEELQQVIQNGIIHFDGGVEEILHTGQLFIEQVRTSTRTPLVSVLLHGPTGSGKTALAASIAQVSEFPFIKLISPDNMVGFTESAKVSAITKIFADSYKSPLSFIVVDNLERLLDWTPIGPRFSNAVLQALLVLMTRRPPKGRRLLVMATTSSRGILTELGLSETFDSELRVPPISNLKSLEFVLREVELFPSSDERRRAMRMLEDAGFALRAEDETSSKLHIGIKKLLSVVEMARQEPESVAERLMGGLMGLGM